MLIGSVQSTPSSFEPNLYKGFIYGNLLLIIMLALLKPLSEVSGRGGKSEILLGVPGGLEGIFEARERLLNKKREQSNNLQHQLQELQNLEANFNTVKELAIVLIDNKRSSTTHQNPCKQTSFFSKKSNLITLFNAVPCTDQLKNTA